MKYRFPIQKLCIAIVFISCEGPMGPSGLNSLLNIFDEPAGTNCATGGIKVESGLDRNNDNNLDASEVTQTKYVCNGNNGLAVVTEEPKGNNCIAGGYKLQVGPDLNGNLTLENSEVQATKYICGVQSDKQVRIELGAPNFGTNSKDWTLGPFATWNLIKFNKLNYANVDSITFVPSMSAGAGPMSPGETNVCHVELFNVTDNVSINNSHLQWPSSEYAFRESRNIYDDLPAREITLGIRVKSENINFFATTGIRSYIFIYKH